MDIQEMNSAKMGALSKLIEALKEMEKEGWSNKKKGTAVVIESEETPDDASETEETGAPDTEDKAEPAEGAISDADKEDIKKAIFKKLNK